jgi:peroxiredoxin
VSFDSPEDNAAFAAKNDFPFQLLSDSDRRLALALGLVDSDSAWWAPRTTFIVDPTGVITEVIETQSPGAQAQKVLQAYP